MTDAAIGQARPGVGADNRANGRLRLAVEAARGRTRRASVYEDGPLRVRFPTATGTSLEAAIINTAGGVVGGDQLDIAINVEAGSDLTVTTAAAEKVYRSEAADAAMAVRLSVGSGASLAWLPQETIVFDRARLSRSIDVELAHDAALLLSESVVFGRSAMDETVRAGHFVDRWRVRRGGKLVFAETMRLTGAIAAKLAEPAVANGGAAVATVLMLPAGEPELCAVRGLGARWRGEVGISCWNGLAAVRLCAKDGAMLRHDLIAVLTALGRRTLPRLWLN